MRVAIVGGDDFVGLDDASAEGLYVSRSFALPHETLEKELLSLESPVRGFVTSHAGTDHSAHLNVRLEYLLERPALLSGFGDRRSYPAELRASLDRGRLPRARARACRRGGTPGKPGRPQRR
jgi:GTP cyclohydrolase I